jgi:hypothetical protein
MSRAHNPNGGKIILNKLISMLARGGSCVPTNAFAVFRAVARWSKGSGSHTHRNDGPLLP